MHDSAVVIGGTRRVGRWAAEALLVAGYSVQAVYARDSAAAAAMLADLPQFSGRLGIAQADATDAQQLGALAAQFDGAPPLKALVIAPGAIATGALLATDGAEFEQLWRGNMLLAHNCVRAFAPLLSDGGRIVAFVSAGNDSLRAYRSVPAYAAAKTMLVGYCRSLARELAPAGVTVNCIALGLCDLPQETDLPAAAQNVPSGRLVGQEDVAAALWYVCSAGAAQLTGSVLTLSGGFGL